MYVPRLRGPVAAPIGYVIGKVPIKVAVETSDRTKQGGRTNTRSIAINQPGASEPDRGPSSRSAIAAGAPSRLTAASNVQMKIRTGNSFLRSGVTLGASPMPIAGHDRSGHKAPMVWNGCAGKCAPLIRSDPIPRTAARKMREPRYPHATQVRILLRPWSPALWRPIGFNAGRFRLHPLRDVRATARRPAARR